VHIRLIVCHTPLLTLRYAADSFAAMGMGSPENRPQGADDSYRETRR